MLADWNSMLSKINHGAGPWSKHFELFEKFGFKNELILIINLFRINDQDHIYFGSIIKFLCDPLVNNLFSEWSAECFVAQRLSYLSDFLIIHKVSQKFPASNQLKSAKQLLHGRLIDKSLLAITLERLPLTDRSGKEWYLTLSTWLLVRAFRYACDENYNDEYLTNVFSRLRMAADNDEVSLSVIRELMPSSIGLYDIETQLIGVTARLIKFAEQSSAIMIFLRSLERVAKGEQKPNKENSLIKNLIPTELSSISTHVIAPEISDIDSSNGLLFESDEGYLEGVFDSTTISPTFAYQNLEGYAVLLNSIVDSQYLIFEINSATETELLAFTNHIEGLSKSSSLEGKTLATLVWVCIQTCRTLNRGMQIPISEDPQSEWTLNPKDYNLYRTPPHRVSDWRPSNQEHLKWLKPYASVITIQLPDFIKKVLKSEKSLIESSSKLCDLWGKEWIPIEQAFQQYFASFDHYTPSVLAKLYPQHFLRKFSDESVAQLISSHPQSGLNASCAYANFTKGDAEGLQKESFLLSLPDCEVVSGVNVKDSILFGSALDVDDEVLKTAIEDFNLKYASYCESANYVERHNAITRYLLLMIYAAVGGRPIKDPFESILHFDFKNHFLYLDDKVVKGDATGRLVPVPADLCKFIEKKYLTHLRILANQLETKNLELSQEIRLMVSFKPSGKLPFFFCLDAYENVVQWTRTIPRATLGFELFDCPLPLNMFRHRYAKKLRKEGLNYEIVAGFLGHVDSGSAPYGIHSHRCFMDDVEIARPIIEKIFNELPFNLNANFHRISPSILKDAQSSSLGQYITNDSGVLFGKAARAKAREDQIRVWSETVDADIQAVFERERKSFTALDEDVVEKLVLKMLAFDNGLARPNRVFRYDYFCNRLEAAFNENGQFVPFKKRYVSTREDSVFEEESAYALWVYRDIRKQLGRVNILRAPSRLNKKLALQLIPLLLLFETRLCDLEQIKSIVLKNWYRIVVADDGYFLVIFNGEPTDRSPLARKYRISQECAYLLDRWGAQSQAFAFEDDLDSSLMHLFADIPNLNFSNFESLLDVLGKVVDQANHIQFIGIEAGFLSGKLESYDLHIEDWVRLRYGKLLDLNHDELSSIPPVYEEINFFSAGGEQQFLPEKAKAFVRELRNTFFSSKLINSQFNTKSKVIIEIQKVINSYESEVSSSLLIFSKWIIKLIELGAKKRNLKLSSILRYFDSMAKPLSELMFNTDLILSDEEEVTEAYTNIITASSKSNQGYLSNRIIAFHQFAVTFHVADPIWSEVPLVKLSVKVSPGFIDEKSYQESLKVLYSGFQTGKDGLLCSLLLIFSYRFGLRANEVYGVLRKDIKSDDELMWLLVRSNHIRALKNRHSARRVPLLFELSKMEQTIIRRGMAEAEAEFSNEMGKPIFHHLGRPLDRLQKKRLSLQVSQVLKSVTGSLHTTLHHCRHSAANRIALAFINSKLKGWGGADTFNDLNAIVFGHREVTKRTSWAVSRYLGQCILDTQYRSYIHFLSDLVETRFKALKVSEDKYSLTSKNVIQLSALKEIARVDYSLLSLIPSRQTIITPLVILRVFKLVGMGKNSDWIAEHLDIPTQKINSIFELLKKQLYLVTVNNKPVNVQSFFNSFKKPVWERLTQLVSRAHLDNGKVDLIRTLRSKCGVPSVMVGATRQIVLWNSVHFRIMQGLNLLFELGEKDYKVFVSIKNNKNLNRYLRALNLESQFKQHYQLDAISSKESYIKPRAVIVADSISKNAKTSFELVTLLLVLLSISDVI